MTDISQIAKAANIPVTPELREFAWLLEQRVLVQFWEGCKKQVEYQQTALDRHMKNKRTELGEAQ